jgi:hypothetical protein
VDPRVGVAVFGKGNFASAENRILLFEVSASLTTNYLRDKCDSFRN